MSYFSIPAIEDYPVFSGTTGNYTSSGEKSTNIYDFSAIGPRFEIAWRSVDSTQLGWMFRFFAEYGLSAASVPTTLKDGTTRYGTIIQYQKSIGPLVAIGGEVRHIVAQGFYESFKSSEKKAAINSTTTAASVQIGFSF